MEQVKEARAALLDCYRRLLPAHMEWSASMLAARDLALKCCGTEPDFTRSLAERAAVEARWREEIVTEAVRLTDPHMHLPAMHAVAKCSLVGYLESGDGILATGEAGCRYTLYVAVLAFTEWSRREIMEPGWSERTIEANFRREMTRPREERELWAVAMRLKDCIANVSRLSDEEILARASRAGSL